MNIDWLGQSCSNKNKLHSKLTACNLSQTVTLHTRISVDTDGINLATCIDHIYTNVPNICSKAVSLSIGFSYHNNVASTRKTKLPATRAKIIYTQSYKRFSEDCFINEILR